MCRGGGLVLWARRNRPGRRQRGCNERWVLRIIGRWSSTSRSWLEMCRRHGRGSRRAGTQPCQSVSQVAAFHCSISSELLIGRSSETASCCLPALRGSRAPAPAAISRCARRGRRKGTISSNMLWRGNGLRLGALGEGEASSLQGRSGSIGTAAIRRSRPVSRARRVVHRLASRMGGTTPSKLLSCSSRRRSEERGGSAES